MTRFAAALALCLSAPAAGADVLTTRASVSVEQAVANLTEAVEAAGARVFAVIDHARGAESVGEDMPPTVKVIFGNPNLGTPAIQAAPRMGLALPLEMLIWQAEDGAVFITTPDMAQEAEALGLDPAHPSLERIRGALAAMTKAAAG